MTTVAAFADAHNAEDESQGALSGLTSDIADAVETFGAKHVYMHGDMAAPSKSQRAETPHYPPNAYDQELWSYVDDSGHGEKVLAVTAGNHDVPIHGLIRSDDRGKYRYSRHYGGLSVICPPTSAGTVTGGPGEPSNNTPGGVGVNTNYVPYTDLKWLENELDAAGTNTKLILPHAGFAFGTVNGSDLVSTSDDENIRPNNMYWICLNNREVRSRLEQYSKVVVIAGHIFDFDDEESFNRNGVEYVYKNHYYWPNQDRIYDYAVVNGTVSGVSVNLVDHGASTGSAILDKTW